MQCKNDNAVAYCIITTSSQETVNIFIQRFESELSYFFFRKFCKSIFSFFLSGNGCFLIYHALIQMLKVPRFRERHRRLSTGRERKKNSSRRICVKRFVPARRACRRALCSRGRTHAVVSARLWNADQPVWFIQSSAGATHDGLRLPRILFAPCIIGSTTTRADVLHLFLSLSLFLNKK